VIRELGRGAYGIVEHVKHIGSGLEMAVKRITAVSQEQKRLLMDMDVLMKGMACASIVKFYGALYSEGDLWIFMEKMDSSLDKFYKLCYEQLSPEESDHVEAITLKLPEQVLGKIAANVVTALHYLHSIKVIHRDVKPSNILINRAGEVKLCDFGISGYLVNSVAKTFEAGCKPYMAPERINPDRNRQGYDIRSDVWSLGITMLELSIGKFPYPQANSFFEQLKRVCTDEPPKLPDDQPFTEDYRDFTFKWYVSTLTFIVVPN
jgi:serine/threonine protein kinase